MAIQPINFPRFSFEELNPLMTGYQTGQNMESTNLDILKKAIQAKYLPMTSQAEAASKMAYANLMGPQFLAKLMGNPDILANIPDPQKRQALSMLYSTGTGQGTGNAFLNPMLQNTLQNSPFQNVSQEDKSAIDKLQPGQSYVIKGNGNQSNDQSTVPSNLISNELQGSPEQKTFAENAGEYQGIKEEGKKLGETRANAIDELGGQYQQYLQAKIPIDHLMQISQNPVFMNMRNQIPFFQDKQLQVLAKIGTPEQQRTVGDFITSTNKAVADTINGFRGRILDKEITMANNMKVSPNDTWNTMMGKLSSVATFNEIAGQRALIASKLMQKEHLNKMDALEKADKMVDGNKIRKQIDKTLSPTPTDEDIDYMAKKYNLSSDEVKKRLRDQGAL